MSGELTLPPSLEHLLGRLLYYGTYAASAVIALGLLLDLAAGAAGMRIATIGIVLFILLPVLRVGAMLVFFWRARDLRFAAVAALVLLIIASSFVVGAR